MKRMIYLLAVLLVFLFTSNSYAQLQSEESPGESNCYKWCMDDDIIEDDEFDDRWGSRKEQCKKWAKKQKDSSFCQSL